MAWGPGGRRHVSPVFSGKCSKLTRKGPLDYHSSVFIIQSMAKRNMNIDIIHHRRTPVFANDSVSRISVFGVPHLPSQITKHCYGSFHVCLDYFRRNFVWTVTKLTQLGQYIQTAAITGNIRGMHDGIKMALGPTQSKTAPSNRPVG